MKTFEGVNFEQVLRPVAAPCQLLVLISNESGAKNKKSCRETSAVVVATSGSQKVRRRAGEMAEWLGALGILAEDPGLDPTTHVVANYHP